MRNARLGNGEALYLLGFRVQCEPLELIWDRARGGGPNALGDFRQLDLFQVGAEICANAHARVPFDFEVNATERNSASLVAK